MILQLQSTNDLQHDELQSLPRTLELLEKRELEVQQLSRQLDEQDTKLLQHSVEVQQYRTRIAALQSDNEMKAEKLSELEQDANALRFALQDELSLEQSAMPSEE